MSLSQKIAFNTLIQVFSKAVTSFFTLLTTLLLTGLLGRDGFGDYTVVITILILFGALSDWGTTIIGVREVAKEKKRPDRVLANLFGLKFLMALLATPLLILFARLIPLQTSSPLLLRRTLMIASLFLILTAIRSSARIVFQVRLQLQKMALVEIITSGLIFFLSWLVSRLNISLLALVGAYLLATGLGVAVAVGLVLQTVKLDFRFDREVMARLLKEALPMGAILLMFTMDNRIDTLMLGVFQGSGAVGIYGLASRVYDVLILGAAFLMNALLPVISTLAGSSARLKRIYQKTFDVLFLMGLVVVVFLLVFAPQMVRFLTGQRFEEFNDSIRVLRLFSPALFLAYFNHLTGYTIVALGKQGPYFFVALASLIFNFLANLLLIPQFSYFGAVVVTILTEGLVLMITTFFLFKWLGFLPSLFSVSKTALQLIKVSKKLAND